MGIDVYFNPGEGEPLEEALYIDDLLYGELWIQIKEHPDFPLLDRLVGIEDDTLIEFEGAMVRQLLGELEAFAEEFTDAALIRRRVEQFMETCRVCLQNDYRLMFGGDSI
jgi:hypothetical protein